MAIMDFLKGPKHYERVVQLEAELASLKERYAQLQALAKKYGAMEVAEVQELVAKETVRSEFAQRKIAAAEAEASAVVARIGELRNEVLVIEEVLLLESFALYVPKFKLNASYFAAQNSVRLVRAPRTNSDEIGAPTYRSGGRASGPLAHGFEPLDRLLLPGYLNPQYG